MDIKNTRFDTKLIHAGDIEDSYGSAVTPIYQTSTFAFKNAQHGSDLFSGKEKGYIYTRIGNPTIEALENKLAELEEGIGGIAFGSGMGAVSCVYLSLLKQGDHILSTAAIYGPARGLVENLLHNLGIESTYIDTANIDLVEKSIKTNTKLVFLETPANPTMRIADIKEISEIAHKHQIPVCVDNTFSSPYLQQPLNLGADIVLHSLTKFINGHADIVGGAVICKYKEHLVKIRKTMTLIGSNMDPHQAYMVIRGVKTLSLRVERATQNAQLIAEFLEKHSKVSWVKYPGLKSFDQYDLAKRQMKAPGAMISFELKGGYDAGVILMNNVHLSLLAVSLGGVESLIQHPASMTHSSIPKEQKLDAGITDGLVRFSVGIENVEDIINDLSQALDIV